MRIALVVERFEAAGGGVEQAVWNVAHGLAEAGDEVHVIARHGAPSPAVVLHRVAVPSFWQPLRVAAFSGRAGAAVRRGHFDVVHSFCRTRHQQVFNAGGGSHADYMLHAYGPAGAALRRLSPRHALLLEIERRILEDRSQLIQCVSRLVRDQIAMRFGVTDERLEVIHNGVDVARFEPERNAADGTKVRDELDAGNATVWLFAGSGWRRKGLDTALGALARCRDERAQLWVAGSDDVRPWRKLAERCGVAERVRFLGVRTDLERVYAGADGVFLPTRYDAFALVVLEACAAGRPIVTSGAAGAAELVGDAGVVVDDAEDVAGFSDALARLSDPRQRSRMADAGLELAARSGWQPHVEKLRSLYARVCR